MTKFGNKILSFSRTKIYSDSEENRASETKLNYHFICPQPFTDLQDG